MQSILVTISIPNKNAELLLRRAESEKTSSRATPSLRERHNETDTETEAETVVQEKIDQTILLQKLKTTITNKLKDMCNSNGSTKQPLTDDQSVSTPYMEATMEELLHNILENFHINNAVWLPDTSGTRLRIQFYIGCDAAHKQLMLTLRRCQIGEFYGSFVASSQCVTTKTPAIETKSTENETSMASTASGSTEQQTLMQRLLGAVKTRLLIMKIMKEMHEQAVLNFNFGLLLVSAATIACFALADNNAIYMISCMLLSPLIGPIVAGLFGIFIGNSQLALLGLRNCAIGILVATCVGLTTGFILAFADPRYMHGEGLTNEMIVRTNLISLLTGSIVAITCGAAIAIAILNKNTSSLVGAAIAGSLLPPAVNAGFIWSMACIAKLYEEEAVAYKSIVRTLRFANNIATELFILGCISMCLTFSNILFIYLSGFLLLKLKEHLPAHAGDTMQWQQRIALVRSYQRDASASDIILEELHKFSKTEQQKLAINRELINEIVSNLPAQSELEHSTLSDVNVQGCQKEMRTEECQPTARTHSTQRSVAFKDKKTNTTVA